MTDGAKGISAKRIGRRTFLATVGATTAVAMSPRLVGVPTFLRGFPAEAQGRFSGKAIRFMTWTDVGGQAAVKYIAKPFEKVSGAQVVVDQTGATSQMVAKVKASQGKPDWDVITINAGGAFELANAGLLEKPDESKLPNLSRVISKFRFSAHGYAVGFNLWSDGLVYSKKVFGNGPASWDVLWDKRYARKLALPPAAWNPMPELVLMAAKLAGGSERNVEPGWKKLAELKGRVVTTSDNPPQVAELFRAGSLVIGMYPYLVMPSFFGKPEYGIGSALGSLKEGFFATPQLTVIPKGHPGDGDLIHALIDYTLDPTVQGKMAEETFQAPINQDAVLSANASPLIVRPADVAAKSITYDLDYVASVRAGWAQRYTELFG